MRAGFDWCYCLCVSGLCLTAQVWAGEPRLLIQRVQVAGFAHHEGARLWPQLHEGDTVMLVREPANPYDPQAVRVDIGTAGQGDGTLGYLARTENGAVARALDQGLLLQARISHLRETKNPRNRVEIEIWGSVTNLKRLKP